MLQVAQWMPTREQLWELATYLGIKAPITKGKLEMEARTHRMLLYWSNTVSTPQQAFVILRNTLLKLNQRRIVAEVLDKAE